MPSEKPPARCDQIRRLGYDPNQLTPAEQIELLEIETRLAAVKVTRDEPLYASP